METRLYTVHHKGSGDVRAVADRFDWFAFKAVARALRDAVEADPRKGDAIPSTKGTL